MRKTAVILFSLGGPDSREAIAPFLKNFFMDRNIIRAPLPVRFFLSRFIAYRRSRREAGDSYALLGNKSPLLENTLAQGEALQKKLGDNHRVFVCMRYWHPMAAEVAQDVKAWGPDRIVLLPLYPQYSTTTTRSSFQEWDKAVRESGISEIPSRRVCCYPVDEGFIRASAEKVKTVYETALKETGKNPRILFSAHGLPEKIIQDGDPYQWQCERSAEDIAGAAGLGDADWQISYQSRVGPLKWIEPSTEEALERAALDKVPVVIYPHAFVCEHVETLVEIEIEYRELAEKLGVPGFYRVPTVDTAQAFIDGLAELVQTPEDRPRICPKTFRRCGK